MTELLGASSLHSPWFFILCVFSLNCKTFHLISLLRSRVCHCAVGRAFLLYQLLGGVEFASSRCCVQLYPLGVFLVSLWCWHGVGLVLFCWTTLLLCLDGCLFDFALRACMFWVCQLASYSYQELDVSSVQEKKHGCLIIIPRSKKMFNISASLVPQTDSITVRDCSY